MSLFSISTKTLSKNSTTKATGHYISITRQKSFSKIKDKIYYEEGQLPQCDEIKSMIDYWKAADTYVRKNGRTCRQIFIALQEEFTVDQNIELVEKLLDHFKIRENYTYCFAIHSKTTNNNLMHQNVHAHIMFNERTLNPNRHFQKASEIFARYNGIKLQDKKGGLKIDRYFKSKEFLQTMRKYWADINNEKFEELEINKKISEKTLKAQREELEAEGRHEAAQKLNRAPQKPHRYKTKKKSI